MDLFREMMMKFNPENGAWQTDVTTYGQLKQRLIENGYKIEQVEQFNPKMKPKVKAWTMFTKDKYVIRLSYTKPSLRESLNLVPGREFDMLENTWGFPIRENHAVSDLLRENCDEVILLGKDASFPENKKTAQYVRI